MEQLQKKWFRHMQDTLTLCRCLCVHAFPGIRANQSKSLKGREGNGSERESDREQINCRQMKIPKERKADRDSNTKKEEDIKRTSHLENGKSSGPQ